MIQLLAVLISFRTVLPVKDDFSWLLDQRRRFRTHFMQHFHLLKIEMVVVKLRRRISWIKATHQVTSQDPKKYPHPQRYTCPSHLNRSLLNKSPSLKRTWVKPQVTLLLRVVQWVAVINCHCHCAYQSSQQSRYSMQIVYSSRVM